MSFFVYLYSTSGKLIDYTPFRYDPEGKKKDRPAREGDDDSRCGISSMQKMDGEDLNLKARKKFQDVSFIS